MALNPKQEAVLSASEVVPIERSYPWLPVWLVGGIALFAVVWWGTLLLPEPTPTAIHGRAASASEVAQLTGLVQRSEAILYQARRTGDVSALPTIFADDSRIRLSDGWYALIDDDPERASTLLTGAGMELPDGKPGFLTVVTVETLQRHQDGPPFGASPAKPVLVSDVEVRGSHAGAIVRLLEGSGTFFHYVFTHVDGQWLISSIWSDCDPRGCA